MKHNAEGKEFMGFHEVRGAVVTANATLSNGTAATLVAGDADYFLDIQEITFSTGSTAALGTSLAGIDIINDGTIVRHVDLLDGGLEQLTFDIPLKQITKGTPWIVDMDDVSSTTVQIGATLIKDCGK